MTLVNLQVIKILLDIVMIIALVAIVVMEAFVVDERTRKATELLNEAEKVLDHSRQQNKEAEELFHKCEDSVYMSRLLLEEAAKDRQKQGCPPPGKNTGNPGDTAKEDKSC